MPPVTRPATALEPGDLVAQGRIGSLQGQLFKQRHHQVFELGV
jgi:hypothetical protein